MTARTSAIAAALAGGTLLVGGCATKVASVPAEPPPKAASTTVNTTYYGPRFHGRKTASGERFDRHAMTAAHRTHPFGTRLAVLNPANGREIVVRINDRGPFTRGYSLDLSEGAFRTLGMRDNGPVEVSVLP